MKAKLSDMVDPNEKPSTVFCDSQSAISLVHNPVHGKRARHIHTRYLFSREHFESGEVDFAFIPTKENWADIFTKRLPKVTHDYLANKMLVSDIGGVLCDYKERPIEGRVPERDRIEINLVKERTTHPRVPMDISDYDREEDIIMVLEEKRREEDKFLEGLQMPLDNYKGAGDFGFDRTIAAGGAAVLNGIDIEKAWEAMYAVALQFGFAEYGGVATKFESTVSGGAQYLTTGIVTAG